MSKNRLKKQHERRKIKKREENLDWKNAFGRSDPTPKTAIDRVMGGIRN